MKIKNFITFEGGECSGKTTIINEIIKMFDEMKISYIQTREPGGIKIAEEIRDIILDINNTMMTPECEALLYAAARMQHLKEKIIPNANMGKIVLCDRYLDSSIAYQGVARGLGIDKVLNVNSFALDYLPDLTIFIDVLPEVALKRLSLRDKTDRLDLENNEFHNLVYKGYHEAIKLYPDRIKVVDGNQPLEDVIKDCKKIILDYIGE